MVTFIPDELLGIMRLMCIIGTAEGASEHPLGKAVVKYVKDVVGAETLAKCDAFTAVPGRGLRAHISEIEQVIQKEPNSETLNEREKFKQEILIDESVNATNTSFNKGI